ncbi:hypothetical protein [Candidatus Uabimicrobium sp. HlEnr_7]|uniref:hypothetical protein n=1 Tax=Candidatus Uabimicrobium helgolandensis TaxID=3095367 RepID=UPI0035576B69
MLLMIGNLIVCSFADNSRLDDQFVQDGILILDMEEGDDFVSVVAQHDAIVYAGQTNSAAVSNIYVPTLF